MRRRVYDMAATLTQAARPLARDITSDEAAPAPRDLVGGGELARLNQRSDLRGFLRLGARLACMAGTGALVWLAMPFWPLLIPAMVLHGATIVTLFAPMHECVHR